ncbi:MAG: gluconate 2-dehydrogenase subunit 3 family protein [Pseudomonadota bacterium]
MPAPMSRAGNLKPLEPAMCSRRDVFRLCLGTVLGALAPFFPAPTDAARKNRGPNIATTLSAYLDTLIPRDNSPGALDTGGLEHMLASAEADLKLKVLIQHGTAWLDEHAREAHHKPFSKLDPSAREMIVEAAAQAAKNNSVPRAFFEETRRVAMRHFYAHPSAWPALNYQGPPQPAGFPDYTQPPA